MGRANRSDVEYHECTKINAECIMKKKNVTFGNVHLDDDRMVWGAVCEHGDKSLTYFKSRNFLNSPAFCSMEFLFSYT
jgi:hypothetical protein